MVENLRGGKPWTTPEVKVLKALWAMDATAGEIAKAVGRSRSAVLGMVHRQQLAPRAVGRRARVR